MDQIPTLHAIKTKQAELAALIAAYETAESTAVSISAAEISLRDGERYGGLILKDGVPSHHLVLLPDDGGDLSWAKAKEWAASVSGELPTRSEQSLLFANCKDAFDACWHWSCEAYGDTASYAWYQLFSYGDQSNSGSVSHEPRARAVRRVSIQ